jgi:hydroxylamine reductase
VDFDPERFVTLIQLAVEHRNRLKASVKAEGGDIATYGSALHFNSDNTAEALVKQAKAVGFKSYPAGSFC